MNSLDIKSDLHKLIDKTNDLQLLNTIKILLSKSGTIDNWKELPKSVQGSIEKALEQIEKGETLAHEEIKEKHAKWL